MTINLPLLTLQAPLFGHGALATARLPFVAAGDTAGLASAAASVGMNPIAANQFQHPVDGSWAIMNGNRVERGVAVIHFRGVPADLLRLPTHPLGQRCAATQISPQPTGDIKGQLTAAGFAETSKSFFAHPDGSWVAVTADRGVVRGLGQGLLDARDVGGASAVANSTVAVPAGFLDLMQTRAPTFEDGFLACAFPGRLDPQQAAMEATGLLQQGFVQTHPGYFEHPSDQSWIAFTAQPSVERGVGGIRFDRVPLNPTRLGQTNPPAHAFALSAANPNVQALTLADVQQSDAVLVDGGFVQAGVRPLYFHADGCFIAFTAAQTYIGQNQQLFATLPHPLDPNTAVPSRPEHAYRSIAKTNGLALDAALPQALIDLGFVETVRGAVYTHVDGSWVAVQNNSLLHGVGTELLADVPVPPPPGSVVRDHSKPPLPTSMRGYGIATVGIVAMSTIHDRCPETGFVNLGSTYVHPDGSWVDYTNGSIQVGWKGYALGDMYSVYQNGTGWM
jgi:hypothetical protein